MAVINGTAGPNRLTGTALDDLIEGLAGDDVLKGAGGNDTLGGGSGDDILEGGAGNDRLEGGAGDDLLVGGDGRDRATYSGSFFDYKLSALGPIVTVHDDNAADGDEGTDLLLGVEELSFADAAAGATLVVGGHGTAGNDLYVGNLFGNTFDGGAGDDLIAGNAGNDTLAGGAGNDLIAGGAGNDTINAGAGDDTIFQRQGDGADTIVGGAGTDVFRFASDAAGVMLDINASSASPYLNFGANGVVSRITGVEDIEVELDGAAGASISISGDFTGTGLAENTIRIRGTNGPDVIDASGMQSSQRLIINARGGDDVVTGGRGNDIINGGAGNDTLRGGLGNDQLTGGAGNDRYIVGDGGADTITDLAPGDTIQIQARGFETYANVLAAAQQVGGNTVITFGPGNTLTLVGVALASLTPQAFGFPSDVVASTPTLSVQPAQGDEDTAIALDIAAALTDTDGSETLAIVIESVPAGATLSAGADQGNGVWELTPAQLAGLTITPAANADADFTLTVRAIAIELNGGARAEATAALPVQVNAVPDATDDVVLTNAALGTAIVLPEWALLRNDAELGGLMFANISSIEDAAGVTLGAFVPTLITQDDVQVTDDAPAGGSFSYTATSYIASASANVSVMSVSGTVITGGAGDENLVGSPSADTLSGGGGDDVLLGGANEDQLVGGAGNDYLDGGQGADDYLVGSGDGIDRYFDSGDFTSGTDRLLATADNVAITFQGSAFPGFLYFGQLTRIEEISANGFSGVTIQLGAGNDALGFGGTTLTGIEAIDAGDGNDEVSGTSDADTIIGGRGNDVVRGDDGDDTLFGGDGNDALIGDSSIQIGFGNDTIDGGADFDTAFYAGNVEDFAITIVDAAQGRSTVTDLRPDPYGDDGTDQLVNVEALAFTNYTLYLDGTNNAVIARDDTVTSIDGAPVEIVPARALFENDVNYDGDTLSLAGVGNAQNGTVAIVANGNVVFTPASVAPGSFQYSVSDGRGSTSTATVTVNVLPEDVASPPTLIVQPAQGDEDTAIPLSIAAALTDDDGSESLAIRIEGVPIGATLSGGTDQGGGVWFLRPRDLIALAITPAANSDADFTLTVYARATESNGGAIAEVSAALPVQVNAVVDPVMPDRVLTNVALGTAIPIAELALLFNDTGLGTDFSRHVDNVFGAADGALGAFTPNPGWQSILFVDTGSAGGSFSYTASGEVGSGEANVSVTSVSGTTVLGGAPDEVLIGDSASDTLIGGAGNDWLDGGEGSDDYLVGIGDGFDVYGDLGLSGVDRILATADGVAIGFAAPFNPGYTVEEISANGHAGVTIQGTGADDILDFRNTLLTDIVLIDGGDGADYLVGSSGGSTILGGAGNDSLGGGNGADTLFGGDGADNLSGFHGDDRLDGGAGADQLVGYFGDDLLDGGAGTDRAVYFNSIEQYEVIIRDRAHGEAQVRDLRPDNGDEGTDQLFNIEDIEFINWGHLYLDGTNNVVLARDDAVAVIEDVPTVLPRLLENDSDFDGDPLTIIGVANEQNGTVALDANGNPVFTAASAGPASFQYTVSDGRGSTSTATVTVAVVPETTASAPTVAVQPAQGDEDTAIPLSIAAALTDTDGSESLEIIIQNVPAGATLSAGTDQGSGAWALTAAQLNALTITPAPNSDADFTLTVLAIVTERNGGATAVASANLAVTVNSVNDAPTIVSNGGNNAIAVLVPENTTGVAVVAATDPDAGATIGYSIVGGEDPSRFAIDAATGVLSFAASPDYEAPADFGLNNTYNVVVRASDGTLSDTQSITVFVQNVDDAAGDATASMPTLTVQPAHGDEDTAIPLGIAAALTDTDGSESLAIRIEDVPAGAALSAGADQGNGVWTLTPAQLAGLTITPPSNSDTDFTLTVRAISTESNGGATAQASAVLAVTVDAVDDPLVFFTQSFGAIREGARWIWNITAVDVDTAGPVTYSVTGELDAAAFTVDANTGAFRFATAPDYENPADHPDDAIPNLYRVQVTATNGGSTVTQNLGILVRDSYLADAVGSVGLTLDGVAVDDRAGNSVGGGADVNGDGFDDVIVGAWFAAPSAGQYAGQSYVVFGSAAGSAAPVSLAALPATAGFRLDAANPGSLLGSSVSGAGDFNNDGYDDVLVGAPGSNDAFVVLGRASFATAPSLSSPDGTSVVRIVGNGAFTSNGSAVANAGDVNGDGIDDIITSNQIEDFNGGAAYVLYGRNGALDATIDLSSLSPAQGFRIAGAAPRDYLGASVASAGDFNGDGYGDVIVGTAGYDPGDPLTAGDAYVLFGGPGNTMADTAARGLASLTGADGFRIDGVVPEDFAGTTVGSAGDVNGDGFDDLVIGAPSAVRGGVSLGEAYVVFGTGAALAPRLALSALDGTNGFRVVDSAVSTGQIGASVSSAGDFNADGFDDLLVGVAGAGLNGSSAYIVYGRGGGFGGTLDLASLAADPFSTEGLQLSGVQWFDATGSSVSAAGDVNGDGFDDVIVGAPNAVYDDAPTAPSGAGRGYVVYGGPRGQGDYVLGDAGDNTLVATGGDQVVVGGLGNDTLVSAEGNDVLSGGAGNDRFVINVNDGHEQVRGGSGIDTLTVVPSTNLFLNMLDDDLITGIERIDLVNGSSSNNLETLRLTYLDVLSLSDERGENGAMHELSVYADPEDQIDIGSGWTLVDFEQNGDETFSVYTQGIATLYVRTIDVGG